MSEHATETSTGETEFFVFMSVQFKRRDNYGNTVDTFGRVQQTLTISHDQPMTRRDVFVWALALIFETNPKLAEWGFEPRHANVVAFDVQPNRLV